MRSYFRRLPYRRLVCLVLAASQLYLLPDPLDSTQAETSLTFVQVYPASSGTRQP